MEPARLGVADRHQVHRAGQQHGHDHAQRQGDFVAHHLGRLAHRPVERPFRARRIAAQDHAEDFQAGHGQDEERARVQLQRHPTVGKRQREKHAERGTKTHVRRDAEQRPIGRGRNDVFLAQQLDAVGRRLQPAEPAAHPRRAQPVLNPRRDLPFQPNEHGRRAERHHQAQHALHHRGERVGQPGGDRKVSKQFGHDASSVAVQSSFSACKYSCERDAARN